jgi:hypothetical protein
MLLFAIPNGGKRHIGVARKLKAEGQRAGVPDLFLAYPSQKWHGFFIEMKYGRKGVLTESQKEYHHRLAKQGYLVKVCRSFEDFENEIKSYISDSIK